jgi:acyl-CoA reductase-like NAD-dependent aldehyde dehydrogenase
MPETYLNYIGGNWVPSLGGRTFEDRNPAHPDELIGLFQHSTNEDVEAAMQAAEDAREDWANTPAPERGLILEKAAHILEERRQEIAATITREMGKVFAEANGFDIQAAINTAKQMVGEGRRMFGKTMQSELRDKFAMVVREPLGVVGAITPWNLPILLPSWKLFPALSVRQLGGIQTGGGHPPVVASCSPRYLEDAGVPGGVLNTITGYGAEIGERLVTHPLLNLISFTGSLAVGKADRQPGRGAAQERCPWSWAARTRWWSWMTPSSAPPCRAACGAASAPAGSAAPRAAGWWCTRPSMTGSSRPTKAAAEGLVVGDGLDPATQVGPVVNQRQLDRIHGYVELGRQEGAKADHRRQEAAG